MRRNAAKFELDVKPYTPLLLTVTGEDGKPVVLKLNKLGITEKGGKHTGKHQGWDKIVDFVRSATNR